MRRKIMIGIMAVLFVIYVLGAFYYYDHFMKHTYVNGIDVSNMSEEKAKKTIIHGSHHKIVTLKFSDGKTEKIRGEKLTPDNEKINQSCQGIMAGQNIWLWFIYYFHDSRYNIGLLDEASTAAIDGQIKILKHMKNQRKAENAKVVYSQSKHSFYVKKEVEGTVIDTKRLRKLIIDAYQSDRNSVKLKPDNGYVAPKILSTDEKLHKLMKAANKYCKCKITYETEKGNVVLDGQTVMKWLTYDGKDYVKKDEVFQAKAEAFVENKLSKKVNTTGEKRTFISATGKKVTVCGGNFGYEADTKKEAAQILSDINDHKTVTRKCMTTGYQKTRENGGLGDTFVEVDMTNQRMYFHKKGKVSIKSSCVTGLYHNKERRTPAGAYYIYFTDRNRTLTGSKNEYRSFVKYWMAFNGGIGLHDASWRSSFGGNIYKYSGSHGCVNLPSRVAAKLFKEIKIGTPVVCYY